MTRRLLALACAFAALLVSVPAASAIAPDLHGSITVTYVNDYPVTLDGATVGQNTEHASATFGIDGYVTVRYPTARFTPRDVAYTATRSDDQGCVHEELGGLDQTRDPSYATVPFRVGSDVQNRLTGRAVLTLSTTRTIDQPFYAMRSTNACADPLVDSGSRTLFEGFETAGSFPGAHSTGPMLAGDLEIAKLPFQRTPGGTWKAQGSRTTTVAQSTTTIAWDLTARQPASSCTMPARRTMIRALPTPVVAALRRAGFVPALTRTDQFRNVPVGRVAQVSSNFQTSSIAPCGARVTVYVRR
jgi:hypothetical protein